MRCHPYFSLYTSACPIPRELFMTHRPLATATPSPPSLAQPARRTEIHFGSRTAAVVRTLLWFIVFSYRERGKRWSYAIIGFVGTEENIKSIHNENRSCFISYDVHVRTYRVVGVRRVGGRRRSGRKLAATNRIGRQRLSRRSIRGCRRIDSPGIRVSTGSRVRSG